MLNGNKFGAFLMFCRKWCQKGAGQKCINVLLGRHRIPNTIMNHKCMKINPPILLLKKYLKQSKQNQAKTKQTFTRLVKLHR